MPAKWSTQGNIAWSLKIRGDGVSSPIVWKNRLFLTSATDEGLRRLVHCLDVQQGELLWSRGIDDENPELSSALTGYAASTPVTNGKCVVAAFGNAGVVCYDMHGELLWHRSLGEFESELGLASSPILFGNSVILVCDHDGSSRRTFDSFVCALDLATGAFVWKCRRSGLFRSWSTPIVVPGADQRDELIVNAQDELRGYDPRNGSLLWKTSGMTGWVTPSPVFGNGLVYACSGRNGPTMAIQPGGRGDVTRSHIKWKNQKGAPYVCSPLYHDRLLYVINEQGILTCFNSQDGAVRYQVRLTGRFMASPVAGANKLYLTNDEGTTYVVRLGESYRLLATNRLDEECLSSPALAHQSVYLRTVSSLYCVRQP